MHYVLVFSIDVDLGANKSQLVDSFFYLGSVVKIDEFLNLDSRVTKNTEKSRILLTMEGFFWPGISFSSSSKILVVVISGASGSENF